MHISRGGQLLPSSLIPFCAVSGDMDAVGTRIQNFSLPVCDAFYPEVIEKQLCYSVNLNNHIEEVAVGGKKGMCRSVDIANISTYIIPVYQGLSLLIDLNKERIVNQKKCISSNDKFLSKKSFCGKYKIYFDFQQVFYGTDEGNYEISDIKSFVATDGFLLLPEETRNCQNKYNVRKCREDRLIGVSINLCKCLPFNLIHHLNQSSVRLLSKRQP